ncbi:unnamed protein product [Eruca vesicaria subsp. sativa]|uniref:Uncharacterized protein n=1 Tax=Eruca vesicaria subsp. sativa TaxID=29727 RepID=A0ABC8KNC6_ERUVS|nr:unnamed protein product [Eruca vesicaria subsp. sativa]
MKQITSIILRFGLGDYWMIVLARWQPKRPQHFPSVLGVPLELRTVPTFESFGDATGKTVAEKVDHRRVQVTVDAFQELCFETIVDFKSREFYDGEEALVSLRYEKLFGYRSTCSGHKAKKCFF